MVRIRSGAAEVIGSGMVTCFGGQPLELAFEEGEVRHEVELRFVSDASVDDVAVAVEQGDGVMSLELTNFDGADGRGSAVPVLLGAVGERLYFFHFRVFRFGQTEDRTVHYTFFRALKADVGWTEVAPER